MAVSQKCQYALRAVYELARRFGRGPVKISELASSQAIPAKFLELILCQLKQGGFVESRRGRRGGYMLAQSPSELAVGQIIRFIDGPVGPVRCVSGGGTGDCSLYGNCAFMGLWSRARQAMTQIYDHTTFEDLVIEHRNSAEPKTPSYCI